MMMHVIKEEAFSNLYYDVSNFQKLLRVFFTFSLRQMLNVQKPDLLICLPM